MLGDHGAVRVEHLGQPVDVADLHRARLLGGHGERGRGAGLGLFGGHVDGLRVQDARVRVRVEVHRVVGGELDPAAFEDLAGDGRLVRELFAQSDAQTADVRGDGRRCDGHGLLGQS